MPTGKVEGMAEALLASECDCFIDCDTTTEQLTKDQQRQFPPRRYQSSKSFWHSISDFGPANQNTSWSSPFERLYTQPLEFGVSFICAWECRALISQTIAFRVTIVMRASSFASPVCPWWSRKRRRPSASGHVGWRGKHPLFWKWSKFRKKSTM